MKITDRDKLMFDQLQQSDTGKLLADYCERLTAEVCDSRTWGDGEDKTHANKVAAVLREHIIDKLVLRNPQQKPAEYPYE